MCWCGNETSVIIFKGTQEWSVRNFKHRAGVYVVVYLKCRLGMVGGREYPLFLEGREYIGIAVCIICSIRGELLIKMKGYIIPLLFCMLFKTCYEGDEN